MYTVVNEHGGAEFFYSLGIFLMNPQQFFHGGKLHILGWTYIYTTIYIYALWL